MHMPNTIIVLCISAIMYMGNAPKNAVCTKMEAAPSQSEG